MPGGRDPIGHSAAQRVRLSGAALRDPEGTRLLLHAAMEAERKEAAGQYDPEFLRQPLRVTPDPAFSGGDAWRRLAMLHTVATGRGALARLLRGVGSRLLRPVTRRRHLLVEVLAEHNRQLADLRLEVRRLTEHDDTNAECGEARR